MKKCPKCQGKGSYLYHLTLEELKDLSSYGGTTNYNPDYMKECEKCKGKGYIMTKHLFIIKGKDRYKKAKKLVDILRKNNKKKLTIENCTCHFTKTGKLITCKFHKQCIGDPCAPGINICDNPKHLTLAEKLVERTIPKLPKTWGQIKPKSDFFNINSAFSKNHKAIKPKCRFCGGETKALNNNGIIGPGYEEYNYACKICGKVQ